MAMITGQAGVLIGPLTATWTPPTDCNYALVNCATCSEGFRGQKCSSSDGGLFRDAQTCWPPTNTKILIPEPTQPFLGWGFYSPGLACPTGYTSACTALYGERPEWPIQFTLNPEETAVGCCPQGYFCTNINGNTCVSYVSKTATLTTATCDGDVPRPALATLSPTMVTDEDGNTAEATMRLLAPMFQLNFQSKDLATSRKTSSSGATRTTTSTIPSTTSSQPSTKTKGPSESTSGPTPEKNVSQEGLSTAAQAGIGVGVSVFALILIALAWWFFKPKRERSAEIAELPLVSQPHRTSHTSYTAYELALGKAGNKDDGRTRHELSPQPMSHELPSQSISHEME